MRLLEKKVTVITGMPTDRFKVVEGFETKINPLRSGLVVGDRCEA